MSEVLGVSQVAKILDVHPQSIYTMIYNDTIPVKPFKVGNRWKWSRRQIDQLLGAEA